MNRDRVIELLAQVLEKSVDEVRRFDKDAPLTELGLDSLCFVSLVVDMEVAFDFELNDSDLLMENFSTVNMIYATLAKYFNSSPTAPPVLKKVLILDCDNVLWDGIAGEEALTVTSNILSFQREIIRLYEGGVLLCLCSKNERRNIKDAFAMLDMPLGWEHIACSKVNRNDKAQNIAEIADELNLSADSFVFADDSDYELGLVNSMLPGVDTVKVDYADNNFVDVLKSFFGSSGAQGLNRTQLFKEQKEREKEKLSFATVEDYNESLETTYICDFADCGQIERIAELSQRTNQFNLSCKRYTIDDIKALMSDSAYSVVSLSAKDKYGDMGIVGTAVLKTNETTAVIESFMLSCRVFGRGFELVLLDKIRALAGSLDLCGIYVWSDKNQRYAGFYRENGVKSMNDYSTVIRSVRTLVNGERPQADIAKLLYEHNCFYLLSKIGGQNEYAQKLAIEIQLNQVCVRERYAVCKPVLETLERQGIPYAVIKGAVLSKAAYGDAYIRKSGDIDLLVRRADIDAVTQTMRQNGFIQGRVTDGGIVPFTRSELVFQTSLSHQAAPFIKQGNNPLCPYINVDVNVDILWGESNRRADMDFVLSHTESAEVCGVTVQKLTPAMEFAALCLHHYKDMNSIYLLADEGMKLGSLCDIYFYIKNTRPDSGELKVVCDRLDVAEYIYYCIYYANEIFADDELRKYLAALGNEKTEDILNTFGLDAQEKKPWQGSLQERLFRDDFRECFMGLLDAKDINKIQTNIALF